MNNRIWKNGQLNAHEVGKGVFVSEDLTRMRIANLQNNVTYREKIEKACKMAGYTDKGLIMAKGLNGTGTTNEGLESLMKQNRRAATIIRNKSKSNGILPILTTAILALSLAFAGNVKADPNFNGWNDSAVIYITGSTSAATKAFPLSQWENSAIVLKAKDTARAGGIDSIHAIWGWQIGMLTGGNDTTWNVPINCDSINTKALYRPYNSKGTGVTLDAGTTILGYVDTNGAGTTHVFKQVRTVTPEWGIVWRFWVKGKEFNARGHGVKYWFTQIRRAYYGVRNK